MKLLKVVLALALGAQLYGAYSYDVQFYYDSGSEDPQPWTFNGYKPTSWSYIYNAARTWTNPNDYEVKTQIPGTPGGKLIQYLRANSATVQSGFGTYIGVDLDLTNGNANFPEPSHPRLVWFNASTEQ